MHFQFYVDLKNLLMYNDLMYLTEKDLKFEIRQVNATINELATDQAGDITYLHQEIVDLKSQIQTLTEQIEFLKDKINES